MDPVTALGAAAGVAQFVGYAIRLFSMSREIHTSVKVCTDKIAGLDDIYGELHELYTRLQPSTLGKNQDDLVGLSFEDLARHTQHANAISKLCQVCTEDCNRLLGAATKLKSRNKKPNRWDSFRTAVKTIWKGSEIAELEQKLQNTQSTLTLNVCALTNNWQSIFWRQLQRMRIDSETLGTQHSTKLNTIENAIKDLCRHSTSTESEQQTGSLSSDDVSTLEKKMSLLSITSSDITKQHIILSSLNCESRVSRYSSITDAHTRTLDWVFRDTGDPNENSNAGNILRWLKFGDGIFWISGKPWSGKSTLMKYITDHQQTLPALSTWSRPHPTVLASHFFWGAGTPMQKSRQGLLKTLLFDVFRQQPNLIEVLCVERWSKSTETLQYEPWHIPELIRVSERIIECDNLSTNFCFFIDGMDEYEGDHIDFCQSLRKLSTSTHVKLCVSSRSWNIFEDSFGRDISSKLYIHEFTRDDIHKYVEDSLTEHPRWADLDVQVKNADSLINQVTQKAAGVFLWVFLVVRELRSGLTEYDSFSDLQRRLEAIPSDFGGFFRQILESIDPFYHEIMSRSLQISIAARELAPAPIYKFLEMECEDEDYALKLPIEIPSDYKITSTSNLISRRLNARCRGLLAVNPRTDCVEFLHHSVRDYLKTNEIASFLKGKAKNTFNVNLSLLRAIIAYIKTVLLAPSRPSVIVSKLEHFIKEAINSAKLLNSSIAYELLEHLDQCTSEIYKSLPARAISSWVGMDEFPVRKLAMEVSFLGYFDYIIPKNPGYLSEFRKGAISTVLEFFHRDVQGTGDYCRHIEMLQYLLGHGHSANEVHDLGFRRSPWEHMLSTMGSECLKEYLQCGLFSLMLNHGAEL
ncbi:hypothetical protein F5B19DRAFT_492001 [Rostrohypoxylon terebratum]|nr:hypothetical protein F5B19DRAFT_492001 [Rostrohypoxylon terebratum]